MLLRLMKKAVLIFGCTLMSSCLLMACYDNTGEPDVPALPAKSIVILHDNDVHCSVDGYTKIAGFRNAINESDTAYSIIVSSGDYIQGGPVGSLSKGSYIIDLMNAVGYNAVTIGNHEFDYKTPRLLEVNEQLKAGITCVNFSNVSTGKQYYEPYIMTTAGNKKIAFVGTLTPSTLYSEYYAFYDEEGNLLYNLHSNDVCNLVQDAVNKARRAGADYVIVLSHLGEQATDVTNSIELIHATTGVDAVFDGHTHSIIPDSMVENKDGKFIPLTQTGTGFANIGKLLIDKDGNISTSLIPTTEVSYTDNKVDSVMEEINKSIADIVNDTCGYSDVELTINDAQGKRLVRCGETNAGDFVADAFRYVFNAEIGLQNGGAVRVSVPAGAITYGTLMTLTTFGNTLLLKKIKGSNIVAILEDSYKSLPGENGGFFQISGIKCTVNCTGEKPTLENVMILNKTTGEYEAMDMDRMYEVALTDYAVSMYADYLKGSIDMTSKYIVDVDATKEYLKEGIKGHIDTTYAKPQGRINCKYE